jgi:hypothetical protein
VLTSANSSCAVGSEEGSLEGSIAMFTDEEIIELVIDKGEDRLTTFDTAILIYVDGFDQGTQTELYNSGASRHMSLY